MPPPTKKEILEVHCVLLLAEQDEKAAKKKSQKPCKNNKENHTPTGNSLPKKKCTIAVQWSKEKYYPLTDQLLTIIEAKPHYCQAFRFSKDATGNVSSGGKKTAELYKEIVEALFVTPEGSQYTPIDLLTLQKAKAYREHHEELGVTGQGLVESGWQDEIMAESKLANVWELIEIKFPWYLCMHKLMGTSPVVDQAAITHSQTPVDLSTLGRHGMSSAPSIGEDNISINWLLSPAPVSDQGEKSDEEDNDNDDDNDNNKNSTIQSSPPSSPSKPQPLATPTPKPKHKAIADKVQEIANMDCSQCMKIAKVKEQEKTNRSQAKYQSKHALEMARMEFQCCEAECAHQHQLLMLEKQVELKHLRIQFFN
ncbi:hypothetical protein L208DRAFT_1426292 [Tricholoma matsutake]|nr:hypothetical protein L208DRAFT_1426292 [Tricholoma matsutake 945]